MREIFVYTYKRWIDGTKYCDGGYQEYTSVAESFAAIASHVEKAQNAGAPIVIIGIWHGEKLAKQFPF